MSKRLVKNYYKYDRVLMGEVPKGQLSMLELDLLSEYESDLRESRLSIPSAEQFLEPSPPNVGLFGGAKDWMYLISYLVTIAVFALAATQPSKMVGSQESNEISQMIEKPKFSVSIKQVGQSTAFGRMLDIQIGAPSSGQYFAAVFEKRGRNLSLLFPESIQQQNQLSFLPSWSLPAMIFATFDEKDGALLVAISSRPIEAGDILHLGEQERAKRVLLQDAWVEIHKMELK